MLSDNIIVLNAQQETTKTFVFPIRTISSGLDYFLFQSVNSTLDWEVYEAADWPTYTQIIINRLEAASGPVRGTFTISYEGWTSSGEI